MKVGDKVKLSDKGRAKFPDCGFDVGEVVVARPHGTVDVAWGPKTVWIMFPGEVVSA